MIKNKYAPLFVIVAASLWGVDSIVLRPSLYHLPVPLVVMVETGIVVLILTPFLFRRLSESKALKGKDWLAFLGVALFGGVIGTLAITKALFYVNYVNLSIVVLIQKLQPIFAVFLAALLLHERPDKRFYYWGGTAILGAYFMTFGFNLPNISSGNKTIIAAGFAFLAAFSYGASTVFSKRGLKNISFEIASYLRFVLTFILLIPIVLATGTQSALGNITENNWLVFGIIAFTSGGPALFLYYYGLKRITASVSTICELSFPLTAILLEYFIRGNLMSPVQWIGALILLYSIIMVSGLQRDA
jgi:drug/metabolite transporter (DMT)-like permease